MSAPIDPTAVRRRLEFLLETRAKGSIARMERDTGISRTILDNALSPTRQTLSPRSAALVCIAYACTLDWLLTGRRSCLPDDLQREIDLWIVAQRWDIESCAPAEDRAERRKS